VMDDIRLEAAGPEVLAGVVKAAMDDKGARVVLLGGTNTMAGVGPKLARFNALPFVNFCTAIEAVDGGLRLTSRLYGGKMLAQVSMPNAGGIIGVDPGAFPADAGRNERTPAMEKLDLPPSKSAAVFKRYLEPEGGDIDITKQEILVSVGRGIQSQENLHLAAELAAVLGGALSASRPLVDQGWLPMTRQVGKSGMSVKPRLYLALGISGAPEHWEGMKDSKLIVAINTDPQAPIFNIAHYGACADLLEVVPALTRQLQERRAKGGH